MDSELIIKKDILLRSMADKMWSQKDLANECNISLATIHRALQGANISPKSVGHLAKGLDVDINQLIRSI